MTPLNVHGAVRIVGDVEQILHQVSGVQSLRNTKDDIGFNQLDAKVNRVCQRCGFVHGSDDAYAINRFSQNKIKFIARHGETQRFTRAEAEQDECNWRIRRAEKR